ncbi:MAG: hypothetical protein HUJ77_13390 [Clostridium sp.]|uniref:hypothetical protein n=1 Tax=Clostridium sp. TaxID=1506 RepID=UPI0025C3C6FF|nr:hypothetical protein [Clostridium sp.]MCF0149375.1 hypothetical protein [Clostridium sp.]
MKYGIDINSEKILSFISEKLKERGHFIIDLTDYNNVNNGKSLLKKVIIANVTNIEFYLSIDFKEDASFPTIFYADNSTKIIANEVMELLEDSFENISCKSGKHLYLIKNINTPVVYISFSIKDRELVESILITNKLINILENIKI